MELFGFNPSDMLSYFLTLFRLSVVLFLLPFFGGQSIPNPVKGALVLILSLALWPQLSFPGSLMPSGWNIVIMFIGELVLGLILGMLVNFLFAAVQLGGQIIGFQMGFAMVNVMDPITGTSNAVSAHFLYMCTMLTFLVLNGHLYLLRAVGMSFEYVPPGTLLLSPEIATNIFKFSNIMFTLAIKIAAPVMASLFLVDLALALISRAAPQMHVLILGFPIKITVGFFFLSFIFSIMALYVSDFLGGLDALYRHVLSFGVAHSTPSEGPDMIGQDDPSKTEKATDKQRRKQREEGNVAKGQEITKVIILLAGVLTLRAMIGFYYDQFTEIYRWTFLEAINFQVDKSMAYALFTWGVGKLTILVLPFMLVLALVAYVSLRLQVGSLWTFKPMKPKFGKLFNIMGGIQKLMISPDALIKLVKSLLQAFAVGIAPYIVLKQEMPNLLPLFHSNVQGIMAYLLTVGYKMVCYALIPMILIAVADLVYERWNYEEKLKMTKDEVKDERKQAEGDPKVKQQQRRKMMEMMASRMFQDIPKADVVITNPTHYAVALQYDPLMAPAPLVLAKGVNKVAERIKEVARENSIPIEENKPLAQALYKQVEIGETIPEELFQAVAAILAKLEKFKRRQ